jgi:hypothetical protein
MLCRLFGHRYRFVAEGNRMTWRCASADYLTASEIFPMETRALAIAFFYAIGTAIGGITGPLLFGNLIGSGSTSQVAIAAEAAREAEWRRRELEREERIRARLRRRATAERGLRRLRPGPGRAVGGSPAISGMAPPPESLDHEISAIERVLNERGPLPRQEIQRLVGARYWGPGVFSRAIAVAVAEGLVKRTGRNAYAPTGENS